jgi:hypothetical protein
MPSADKAGGSGVQGGKKVFMGSRVSSQQHQKQPPSRLVSLNFYRDVSRSAVLGARIMVIGALVQMGVGPHLLCMCRNPNGGQPPVRF